MQVFAYIAVAVIILTITVFILSLFIIVARFLANWREARAKRSRTRMLAVLDQFLAEEISLDNAGKVLRKDRAVALGSLVSISGKLSAKEVLPLHQMFEHLGLDRRELADLRHRDWSRRAHSATRLGVLRYGPAVGPLTAALDDSMLDVRLAAAHSLSQLQATDAIEKILRSLALPTGWPLQRCTEILYEMGPAAVDTLLSLLKGGRLPNPATAAATKALGLLRARVAVPVLITLLNHSNDEIRVSSAKSLGQIGSREALRALTTALGDAAWPVRSAAAQALGLLGDRSAIPALSTKLADPAWWVRFNAAQGIYRLNGREALLETVKSHADRFARDISRQILEEAGVIAAAEGAHG